MKKSKILASLMCGVLTAGFITACGPIHEATFTVGFDAEFPPYGYMDDNGDYTGFDLELAEEVCKRNGWELVKQPIDWDAKDAELNSGTLTVSGTDLP